MLCQRCQQRESTVHIAEGHGDQLPSAASFTLHFCETCGEEYEREMFARAFPATGEPPITERLRVIERSSERTIVRLVRTESQPAPEDWILLTARLPEEFCEVGMEFGVTLTLSQLEYMKGNKDSLQEIRCLTTRRSQRQNNFKLCHCQKMTNTIESVVTNSDGSYQIVAISAKSPNVP
jgi:hypothetical protein